MDLVHLLHEAAEFASDPLLVLGTRHQAKPTVVQAWGNASFRKLIGASDTGLPESTLSEDVLSVLLGETQAQLVLGQLVQRHENPGELSIQVQLGARHAPHVPCEMTIRPMRMRDAHVAYWCASFLVASRRGNMLSDLMDARAEAELSTQRLWDAIEALPDAFVMYDESNRLVACNQKYKDFYKASAPAIFPGAKFQDIMRYGVENGQYPEAKGNEEAWLADIITRFRGSDEPIHRVLSDGRHIVINDIHTKHGDVVGLRTDVTVLRKHENMLKTQAQELEKAKAAAEAASNTDPLTGLGNRRGLEKFFAAVRATLAQEMSIAALHFDLDKFKEINDQHGHGVGDRVLCRLATSLQNGISGDGYAARIGGDEFLAVVWAKNIQDRAEQLASFVINECSEVTTYEDSKLSFRVSVGIACADKASITDLWANSDVALYESKRKGLGSFTHFSPELAAMASEKRQLCEAFATAIDGEALFPFFQPQVAADSEAVIGIEALARWKHPLLGNVSPAKFLPIAQELGLLPDLDESIFRKTLACAERLTEFGFEMPSLSINVSEEALFSDQFHCTVAEANVGSRPFIFELLETIDFEMEGEALRWAVEKLRSLGAQIALDDFGSGKSSLTALIDLRPDRIKIDRRIAARIGPEEQSDTHMMKAICEMAKALNVGVTAEGIESRFQANVASELGCDALQGFFFAAPMSEEDLVIYLSERHEKPVVYNRV